MGSLTAEEERNDGGIMGEEQPVLTSFQMARPVSLSETIGVACAQAVPVESLTLAEWKKVDESEKSNKSSKIKAKVVTLGAEKPSG